MQIKYIIVCIYIDVHVLTMSKRMHFVLKIINTCLILICMHKQHVA